MPIYKIERDGEGRIVATKVEAVAKDNAANIPAWATYTEDEAQDWIDANVTDVASARTALKAMARLLVALRDAQWADLND